MKYFKHLVLVVVGLIQVTCAHAKVDPTDAYFTARTEKFQGATIPYSVYKPPGLTDIQHLPIILALHGSGEAGEDGILNTERGIGPALRNHPDRYQSIVVLPQLPKGKSWAAKIDDQDPHSITYEDVAMNILEECIVEFASDVSRVYVTGNSLGGFATWDLAAQYPDFFAAAIPISGGGDPATMAAKLARLPIYVAHGRLDRDVKFKFSQDMVDAIRAQGNDELLFKAFRFHFHNVWDATYSDSKVTDWLFSQHR